MFTFRLASAFVLLVLAGACGSPSSPKSAVASAPSSSPKSAAASAASPAPAGWVYTEPAWGYSISMPADWHLISAGEKDPHQFKNFSNENVTNAASLTGLDANGMDVRVIVSQLNSGCPGDQPTVGWAESTVPAVAASVDGYASVVSGYAAPDKSLPINNVRQRLFRGYCTDVDAYMKVFALFREKKPEIYALYSDEIGKLIDRGTVKETLRYFDDFYDTINDPRAARRSIIESCINRP